MTGPDDSDGGLSLARAHLERVLIAWPEPTDWADLSLYGFYGLEAAIVAACEHLGWQAPRSHPAKVEAALRLAEQHSLPEITTLLTTLNDARKAAAYGDQPAPDLDAEDVAASVESYVDAVAALMGD